MNTLDLNYWDTRKQKFCATRHRKHQERMTDNARQKIVPPWIAFGGLKCLLEGLSGQRRKQMEGVRTHIP